MKREELEHIIRASGKILKQNEFYVIGSQSILGQYPDAPAELLVSREADIICKLDPENSDRIDGAIGELSPFHDTYGYYAQGVSFETATLPRNWEDRCIAIECEDIDGTYIAYCLELHDTCISKYVASRRKDIQYIKECIKHKLIQKETMIERLEMTEIDKTNIEVIRKKIDRDFD